jgi:YfiH family protein
MQQKTTKAFNHHFLATNSAIEFVAFSTLNNSTVDEKVLAIQTSRTSPFNSNVDIDSPYQGFNLGFHVGDFPEQVEKNRHFLLNLLPDNTKIQWLEQIHGNEVVQITHASLQAVTADAAFTKEKKICLSVMTADCLPILLASKAGDEIAAIHGGWRPLAANIISNTINKMDTDASELCVWLGPCIGKKSFEVGQEVFDAFVSQNPIFSLAFIKHTSGKYFADLHQIAKIQLAQLGVESINVSPECTFSNTNKYYSYRKNPKTGRMASLICLR